MKPVLLAVLFNVFFLSAFCQQRTDILIVGSDHFAQVYNPKFPGTDALTSRNRSELNQLIRLISAYKPDMVMLEMLPEAQSRIDSLYNQYLQRTLDTSSLEDWRSEVFQLAFPLAKLNAVKQLVCVNAPGGTSQSILDNGENIDLYKQEGTELRALVTEKKKLLENGQWSLKDYTMFVNRPEVIRKVYHLRYITPARVQNGTFRNPDAMVDTAFINPRYIGAELTSVFKNRDYKIYSNIVSTRLSARPMRMLLLIGVAHIGSLKSILRDDEEFNLVDANKYLNK